MYLELTDFPSSCIYIQKYMVPKPFTKYYDRKCSHSTCQRQRLTQIRPFITRWPKKKREKSSKPKTVILVPTHLQITAVLAGDDTFLTENITDDRKKFIAQSKHMIFW